MLTNKIHLSHIYALFLIFTINYAHSAPHGKIVNAIDYGHDQIAKFWMNTVEGFDSYFGHPESKRKNNSFIKMSFYSNYAEDEKAKHGISFSIRVHLPKISDRLRFAIEHDSTEKDSDIPVRKEEERYKDNEEYTTALEYIVKKTKKINLRTRVGIRLGSPLNPFIRFKINKNIDFKKWSFLIAERLEYRHVDRLFNIFSADFQRGLTSKLTFRQINTSRWEDKTDLIEFTNSLNLYHQLSKRRQLTYSAGINGRNRPTPFYERNFISLTYRQKIHGSWLFYEITPIVEFKKEDNWRSSGSIFFRIDTFFNRF